MKYNKTKIVIGFVLVLGLIIIRAKEFSLFYDPFMQFFKSDYLSKDAPDFNTAKLLLSTTGRYFLNSLLSIGLLYICFKEKVLRFSVFFYTLSFIVLMIVYAVLLNVLSKETHLLFFYVRRFLIQPIFLLLLLPAFYYQEKLKNN